MSEALRDVFGKQLEFYGNKNKNILAISPDLKQATKLSYFFKKFPARSFEVGIAEANAVGIAAGLALSGYRPVLASFGSFLTGKNIEIRTSIAFNKAPVILIGTHGGLIGPDGPTQAGLQDISVMRSIPNIKVLQPSTPIELKQMLKKYLYNKDPIYMRISREPTNEYFKKNFRFIEGQIRIIKNNYQDAIILTSGPMLNTCYKAINSIRSKKVGLGNLSSIKPISLSDLKKISKKTKLIITIEDHNVMGGLGSAVNESLNKIGSKTRIVNYGLFDVFTQSGSVEDLYKFYRLDSLSIKKYVKKAIKKNENS
jgi:transketolase